MGAARIDVASLSRVSAEDVNLLSRISAEVNQLHFKGSINTPVRWEIPSASEAPEPILDLRGLSSAERMELTRAVQAFADRRFMDAERLIKPFTDRGLRAAEQLYVRILIELGDDSWQEAAARFNRVCKDTLYVPAGSTEILDCGEQILIHPSLSRSCGYGAPRYVLRYVVFHEKLHKFLNTSASNPHPPIFRMMEQTFLDRGKAIEWLQQHHFSTTDDAF